MGFAQFIRLIFFVYAGALSTDDRGDDDGPPWPCRGVASWPPVAQVLRNHALRIKRCPPHSGHRGHLNTSHSAALSCSVASVGLPVEPSVELFADFLLDFA